MPETFEPSQYLAYLRGRWRFIAICSAVAFAAALLVSLLLPKRYTATASIVIEPPAGNDSRSSTAVSPIYLESLRSYELFASGDSLFARAVDRFHLRERNPDQPIESLKRRVLKVNKPRDTKILEISATLEDPRQAQAFAQYLAEETVKLNRSASREADQELIDEAQKQYDAARKRFEEQQAAWGQFTTREPVKTLQSEIDALTDLKANLRRELLEANVEVAGYTDREKSATPADAETNRKELSSFRARAALLTKQNDDVERDLNAKSTLLATRTFRRDTLEAELRTAQDAHDASATRLQELRGAAGYRGERLKIIDPGIVPGRPSSPNILLNVMAALLLAFVASIVYLSVAFSYRRQQNLEPRTEFRLAARHRDD